MTRLPAGTVVVTGGAGFIGSAVVRRLLEGGYARVVTLDCLSYAANPEALGPWLEDPRHHLVHADIRDSAAVRETLADARPVAVLHLAAETHVDRSIDSPRAFVETNVLGTQVMLEETLAYWRALAPDARERFRFVQVSTDEVFGALAADAPPFSEDSPYRPRSPYAASKAGADHLARAWHATYGLPTIVTHCGNNYGPWQFPEKFIPVAILRSVAGQPVPLYGGGRQVRDWIHVEDHAAAILAAWMRGHPGATYCLGGREERSNLELAGLLTDLVDELRPDPAVPPRRTLLTEVADRPGHDFRYALDPSAAERGLGWQAHRELRAGLRETVAWYLNHSEWVTEKLAMMGGYRRLGLEGGK